LERLKVLGRDVMPPCSHQPELHYNPKAEPPNHALQPTADRSDVQFSDDFNNEIRSKARSRQRWLSLVSLAKSTLARDNAEIQTNRKLKA
jgi:hypothetical protein